MSTYVKEKLKLIKVNLPLLNIKKPHPHIYPKTGIHPVPVLKSTIELNT